MGEYRWRLKADNNKIITDSGESYMYKTNAEDAIQAIKKYAKTAKVIDER